MNIKKVGLTALAASLVSFSANAGELTVTGAASISVGGYSAGAMANTPKTFSMGNQFTVSGGGELDNGLTVAYSMQVDQGVPCLLYTSPSPRDRLLSRMPSSA